MAHSIRIDRSRPLASEPRCGHNRYHPDIAPALEIGEGEEVVLETRDAVDGQITPHSTVADLAHFESGRIHPLTGPVFVKGAEPGDMIEVEFLDILPQPTAFSAIVPGLGFLRDVMTTPLIPQGTMRSKLARSVVTLRANPWLVIHRAMRTPMAASFSRPTHTPVSPSTRTASMP